MIYHLLETKGPNFTTNCVHIADEDDRVLVTVWEIRYLGQDELWERAEAILDFLNRKVSHE